MHQKFSGRNSRAKWGCCGTHMGARYFFQNILDPRCGVDWKTETFLCTQCGALLQPPRTLSLFNAFNCIWIGWVAIYSELFLAKLHQMAFMEFFPIMVVTWFVLMHLTPALIASLGIWTPIPLNGQLQETLLEQRRSEILARRKSFWYIFLKCLIALLMIVVAVCALSI